MPDKDDQIKKVIENQIRGELLQKQAKLKNEAQNTRAYQRAAKSEKKHAIAREEWDTFDKHIKERIATGQQGYDTWVAAMSSIVILCRIFINALDASDPLGSIFGWGAGKASDIYHSLADGANVTEEEIKKNLPDLQHYVEFTDDDKLNIASLSKNMRRSDGRDFPPEVKEVFQVGMQTGMELWLGQHGYHLQANTRDVFVDEHGTQLTKALFEELRNEPHYGLDEFLSGRFDMNFQRATGPRPNL